MWWISLCHGGAGDRNKQNRLFFQTICPRSPDCDNDSAQNRLCFCRVGRFLTFFVTTVAFKMPTSLCFPDDSPTREQTQWWNSTFSNKIIWYEQTICSRGNKQLCRLGTYFLHNRLFFIDDFATPGNSHLALKIVYVSAGFWDSGPFLSTTESRISQNRLAWKIVERFEPFRSLRNRWTIENRSTIWKNRWTIWKKYYRESLDICEIVERLPICKSLDIGFKSLKSLDIC